MTPHELTSDEIAQLQRHMNEMKKRGTPQGETFPNPADTVEVQGRATRAAVNPAQKTLEEYDE